MNEQEIKCRFYIDLNYRECCKRHAPIVMVNPMCDMTSETAKNLSYTDGEYTLTIFPLAQCPCGDYEPEGMIERGICIMFDKDATFHKCPKGEMDYVVRPYPAYYCSNCMGKGEDIKAIEYIRILESRLKE